MRLNNITTDQCQAEGCSNPVMEIAPGKPIKSCSAHAVEALACFFETPWEGDTVREMSEGEQMGAFLRDVGTIGTRYTRKP